MNPINNCPKCNANLYDGKWYCVVCPKCKFDLEKTEEESPLKVEDFKLQHNYETY